MKRDTTTELIVHLSLFQVSFRINQSIRPPCTLPRGTVMRPIHAMPGYVCIIIEFTLIPLSPAFALSLP